MTKTVGCLILALGVSLALPVQGGNAEASTAFSEGLAAMEAKRYDQAGASFMEAKLQADSAAMKVKALFQAAEAYRLAGLREKEYGCVETLLNAYPSRIDFKQMVDREYQIGDVFYQGHRDPEFMSLRWIPWLTGSDKTSMIYEAALKHAPFSAYAPEARLRLARLYIDDNKIDRGLKHLRELIRNYPDSDVKKYGYLELASTLMTLARAGDGDGAYNREANEVMAEFIRRYPKAPEVDWIKKRIIESRDINSKRLYDLARFYNRQGRTEPAERYLNKVLRDYPDTLSVDQSEALLSKINSEAKPLSFHPPLENRYQTYQETGLPKEGEPIMIVPECSDGKYLLPVRDLGNGKKIEVQRTFTQE